MINSAEIWQKVSEAIQSTRTVRLSYIKQRGQIVGHEIVPLDILVKIRPEGKRVEYLFGHRLDFGWWEDREQTRRQFLLDRILSLQVTDHRFNPADYVDLSRSQPRWCIPRDWAKAA